MGAAQTTTGCKWPQRRASCPCHAHLFPHTARSSRRRRATSKRAASFQLLALMFFPPARRSKSCHSFRDVCVCRRRRACSWAVNAREGRSCEGYATYLSRSSGLIGEPGRRADAGQLALGAERSSDGAGIGIFLTYLRWRCSGDSSGDRPSQRREPITCRSVTFSLASITPGGGEGWIRAPE